MDEKLIIEKANTIGLTFAKNFNGKPYALMNADWISYFSTLDDVHDYLISLTNIESEGEGNEK